MKIGHKTNQEELGRLGFNYVADFGFDCQIYTSETHSVLLDSDFIVVLFYDKDPKATIYETQKQQPEKCEGDSLARL